MYCSLVISHPRSWKGFFTRSQDPWPSWPQSWGQQSWRTRKHPIIVFFPSHDFHWPSCSQYRAAAQGPSCLSHLTGLTCELRSGAWVSQCWTLSLGDRRSRWCYLFKFRLFLCLFSRLSAAWKVFPLSHRSVLFCQRQSHAGLAKTSGTQCCRLNPSASPASKQPLVYNWTYSHEMHSPLHYSYSMLA